MDFLERLFHVSPDGGTGSLELVYFIVAVTAGLVLTLRRFFASGLRRFRDRSQRIG